MPRTIKWAGMTEPKWVAGKEEEQPGQPIVLEHKLSVQEKDPDLVPFTPHKIHNQDLVVRFPGTQEVVVRDMIGSFSRGRSSLITASLTPST
jgi:hypothetical protein